MPCPPAPPANIYDLHSPTFNEVGQTDWVDFWCSIAPDSATLIPADSSVVTASPSPLTAYASAPPALPPPQNRADLTAKGVGTTQIAVNDTECPSNDAPYNVTVNATPSPDPTPAAVSN